MEIQGLIDYLRHIIYPSQYGYVTQIMVFYVLFYLICRIRSPRT